MADRDEVIRTFKERVNLAPAALERWLETTESKTVGQKSGGSAGAWASGESVGHESGRRIVKLLRTRKADYDDADIDHMRKVNGYIARHLAQRPSGDVTVSRWRYSLMNWGHDPTKQARTK